MLRITLDSSLVNGSNENTICQFSFEYTDHYFLKFKMSLEMRIAMRISSIVILVPRQTDRERERERERNLFRISSWRNQVVIIRSSIFRWRINWRLRNWSDSRLVYFLIIGTVLYFFMSLNNAIYNYTFFVQSLDQKVHIVGTAIPCCLIDSRRGILELCIQLRLMFSLFLRMNLRIARNRLSTNGSAFEITKSHTPPPPPGRLSYIHWHVGKTPFVSS